MTRTERTGKMALFSTVNSFNAGELSPKMLARLDVSQYEKGCRVLKNFLVTPYGAAERRPGTLYLADVKFPEKNVQLNPFLFSSEIIFICEFGDGCIRFHRDDMQAAEIVSPYSLADLPDLKYVQSADVMFLCHGAHPVRELRRTAENTFELREMPIVYPPVLDINLTDTAITPSAQEGEITLTASGEVFKAGHAGSYWELLHSRDSQKAEKKFTKDGSTDSIEVTGYWNLVSYGTWNGTVYIEKSKDGGATWVKFRTFTSESDNNISVSGEETEDGVLYRARLEDYSAADGNVNKYCRLVLTNESYTVTGVVRITSVASATEATADVIKKLGGTAATKDWCEGAWSDVRGYPRTIAFYEERLMFGGTAHQPQTVWGSKVNDWNNFLTGDRDADGLSYTLSSDTVNTICWMTQHDSLIIGTLDSEWQLAASSRDSALTPTNVMIRRQSVFGSKGIPARLVGDLILFVQRQGRKVRGFVYSYQKDGYESPDLTILADHINRAGIIAIALQQQPDTILWCLLADGTLSALTYERDQEVMGWQRVETDGRVKSICIVPGEHDDRIYIAVERGGTVRLERFAPREYESIQDAVFTDSSAVYSSTAAIASVSGLEHLEGREVQILADGAVQKPKTVLNGCITLDDPANRITVGLGYESHLSPMPLETQLQNGSSAMRKKVLAELRIRVYRSVGGEARAGGDNYQEIISRDAAGDEVNQYIEPKDEIVQIQTASGFEREMTVDIRQCDPLPLNVASIVCTWENEE